MLSLLLAVPAFALLSYAEAILLAFHEPALLTKNVGEYCAVLRWGTPGSLIGVGMMRAFLPAIGAARRLLWVSIGGVFVNGFLILVIGALGSLRDTCSRFISRSTRRGLWWELAAGLASMAM